MSGVAMSGAAVVARVGARAVPSVVFGLVLCACVDSSLQRGAGMARPALVAKPGFARDKAQPGTVIRLRGGIGGVENVLKFPKTEIQANASLAKAGLQSRFSRFEVQANVSKVPSSATADLQSRFSRPEVQAKVPSAAAATADLQSRFSRLEVQANVEKVPSAEIQADAPKDPRAEIRAIPQVVPSKARREFGSFVTRSASYSALDEATVTEKLTGPTPTDEEQLINIGTTGQTAAQPKPEAVAIEKLEEELEEIKRKEDEQLKIVIVSSEVAPFSKSGGLADVASKLSFALSQKGHRVMTVSPAYRGNYEGAVATEVRKTFTLYGNGHDVHYTHLWLPTDPTGKDESMGVDHIFVQNKNFERAGMYGDPGGHDYFDNLFRFALLSWAGVEAPLLLPKVAPFGEKVIFVGNDWQTGLVPVILTSHYRRWKVFGPARCLFVIHNMGYHGNFPNPQMYNYDLPDPKLTPKWSFQDLGLRDNSYYDMYKWVFPAEERGDKGVVDDGECAKLLLGAIRMADRVVTVSPSYKTEILTDVGGWKLQHDTRARQDKLDGILNGIDSEEWNPTKDPHLSAHFSAADLSGKAACKAAIQAALGLHQNPDAPLLCFIGRLAPQKGIDVLESAFDWLMGGDGGQGVLGDAQLIMMGSGEHKYAEFMRSAEGRFKGRVCGYVGFSAEMEHKIIAGSDILIMPSRYEPCGLPQMYAQRYGTVPVVHATGGLKDSVIQYAITDQGPSGTGWKFGNCDANGLKWGLWESLSIYKKKPEDWDALRKRCMEQDFSWSASADKYIQLFRWAQMDPPVHQPWPF